MNSLPCKRCGIDVKPVINENFQRSDGQLVTHASCPHCETFLRFLPRNNQNDFKLYFGKYQGAFISELKGKDQISYLRYLLTYDKLKEWQKNVIKNQINNYQ